MVGFVHSHKSQPASGYRCVECGNPVSSLFTAYSADNVRLTQCERCKKFADKYIEHDFVVLFIDIVLIKPQVYRHLLFNLLNRGDRKIHPSISRLAALLTLFDIYLTWARVEKHGNAMSGNLLVSYPVAWKYVYYLLLSTCQTAVLHLTIRGLAKWKLGFTKGSAISTALFISSTTKLLPILMLIWQYDVPAAARVVGWAVVVNNIEALAILLECSRTIAALIALVGAAARGIVGLLLLMLGGLIHLSDFTHTSPDQGIVSQIKYGIYFAGRSIALGGDLLGLT